MYFSPRFRQGVKAAIPIWIAFIPSSLAFGVAAQAHGLHLGEVILMSAWVYSGPAQFAMLAPIAEGKSSLQILLAASVINLRFLPMSAALAPYFRGAPLRRLLGPLSSSLPAVLSCRTFASVKKPSRGHKLPRRTLLLRDQAI